MDDETIERIKLIYNELAGLAKVHKRECGPCGDWANLDDAAELLQEILWEAGAWGEYRSELDPMTQLKQRMEDELI